MSTSTRSPDRSDRADLPSFRTPVRGHAFAPRRADTPDPEPGEPAELVPEPANPADPYAVAVWAGEGGQRRRIGYLDRGVAARVAPRIRAGLVLSARVEGWTREPEGRWQRPVVLLRAEAMPAAAPPAPTPRGSATSSDGPGGASPRRPRPEGTAPGVWGRPPGVARRTLGPAHDRVSRPRPRSRAR